MSSATLLKVSITRRPWPTTRMSITLHPIMKRMMRMKTVDQTIAPTIAAFVTYRPMVL